MEGQLEELLTRIRNLQKQYPEEQIILARVISEIQDMKQNFKPKVSVILESWEHTCGDGCCYSYGLNKTVNGEELENQNEDAFTAVKVILEHLGYEVEIESL